MFSYVDNLIYLLSVLTSNDSLNAVGTGKLMKTNKIRGFWGSNIAGNTLVNFQKHLNAEMLHSNCTFIK